MSPKVIRPLPDSGAGPTAETNVVTQRAATRSQPLDLVWVTAGPAPPDEGVGGSLGVPTGTAIGSPSGPHMSPLASAFPTSSGNCQSPASLPDAPPAGRPA